MRKPACALFVVCALFSVAATAEELRPIEATSIRLGDVSGVAYYTVEPDGYSVVTTLAPGDASTPIRFVTSLLPGQRTLVSVPREPGVSALTFEIARIGDSVHVLRPKTVANLVD